MRDARELVRSGCPEGTIVAADHQSEGRGRIEGRKWLSPPGENLMFTLVLSAEAAAEAAFPLKVGLALVRAVESRAWFSQEGDDSRIAPIPPAWLKWPNDVVIEGKKLAGILCEAGPDAVLVGVGINVNQTSFDPSLRRSATSLRLACGLDDGEAVDRWRLLSRFLFELQSVRADPLWREAIEARLWRRGLMVDFMPGRAVDSPDATDASGEASRGMIEGIDDEGGLVLTSPTGGRRSYFSGEIRLLPGGQTR